MGVPGLPQQAVLRRDRVDAIEGFSVCTIYPGHGSALAVPVRALDEVVAVVQEDDAIYIQLFIRCGPDKAIGYGNGATDPRAAITPGHRTALVVPIRIFDHIITVAQ